MPLATSESIGLSSVDNRLVALLDCDALEDLAEPAESAGCPHQGKSTENYVFVGRTRTSTQNHLRRLR